LTEKPTERAPERLAGKATESDENMRFCRSVQVQGIRFRRIAADVPHLRRGAQHDEKAGPAGRSRISEFRYQPTQTQLSESAVDSSNRTEIRNRIQRQDSDERNQRGRIYSAEDCDRTKERIGAQTVEEVYKAIIAELKERGSVGNAYAYLNSYNMLKSFNRDKPLHFTFSRIDADYLEIFEKWMRARGNKDTSKSFQMRTLRAVFNRTIKPEAVAREKNPFTDYKMSRFNTRTPKRSLSKADVMKIVEADCTAECDFCRLAQNVFTFSYLCGGISFVDAANPTPDNIVDGRLSYNRRKTHGAINVPLSERAMRIVDSYAATCERSGYPFPILDSRRHATPVQIRKQTAPKLRF